MGVVPTSSALELARSQSLDLVLVAPQNNPPVCHIVDYGKYTYEVKKKKRQNKSGHMDWKEIRLSPGIDQHDMETKIKQLRGFLEKGKGVRVIMRYKNRQLAHVDAGRKVLDTVVEAVEDVGKTDKRPVFESRRLVVQIVPR